MRRMATVAIASLALTAPAFAQSDIKLPDRLSWTAYDSTSSGYAQSVGLGNMLKAKYDVDLRIIPGKNDVSRMIPLRAGQADICACGIASYFGQEGVFMFADPQWGPLPVYNLFNNIGRNGQQVVVAGDIGVREYSGLRGKRVTWIKGAPALNVNATAALAFGGLTWDDVQKIEVPGWGQSIQAIIDGQADAAVGSTISSSFNQLASSPRGLFFPTLPHNDEAAWARAKEVAPFWNKQMVSNAVSGENNTSGTMPYEGNNYPYPIFVSLPGVSDDTAYGLTKAVMENFEMYKESGPGMDGYQLENQNLSWIFPYHPGSIRYYKEAGVWTAEDQAQTDQLLKRQQVLVDAWKKFTAQDVAEDQFEAKWLEARAAALKEAGMAVPFAEPFGES